MCTYAIDASARQSHLFGLDMELAIGIFIRSCAVRWLDVALGKEYRKPGLERGYVASCAAQACGLKTGIYGDWMYWIVLICATDKSRLDSSSRYCLISLPCTIRSQRGQ